MRSRRFEELKSSRVAIEKRKGQDLTQRSQRRAGPWERRPDAAFPSFVIPFYDGSLGERISGRRQKSGSQAEGTPKRKSPTKVGAHFSTSNILLDRLCIPQ